MTLKFDTATVLRGAAIYDLIITGGLIFSPLVHFVLGVLIRMDGLLGFHTSFGSLDATTVFFINLAAASVIAWSLIRLRQPTPEALRIDILYRGLLIVLQIWAVARGATPVLLGISLVLAAIAAIELRALLHPASAKATRPHQHQKE